MGFGIWVCFLSWSFSKPSGECVWQVPSCQLAPEDKCLLQLLPLSLAQTVDHWWFDSRGPKLRNDMLVKMASLHGKLSNLGKKNKSIFFRNSVELASFWLMLKEHEKCILVQKGFIHRCCSLRKEAELSLLCERLPGADLPSYNLKRTYRRQMTARFSLPPAPSPNAIGSIVFPDLKSVGPDYYLILCQHAQCIQLHTKTVVFLIAFCILKQHNHTKQQLQP